jgi:tetratricopeptide (TPR) repeat protein
MWSIALAIQLAMSASNGAANENATISEKVQICADKAVSPGIAIAACTSLIEAGHLNAAYLEYVYFNRGQEQDRIGHFDQAISDFSEVIRLQPKNSKAFGFRGAIHGKKGEIDVALKDIDQALALNPNDGDGYTNRGTALEAKGAHVQAIQAYDRAIKLMPENSIAWNGRCWNRAVVKVNLNDALSDCNKAIALDGGDPNSLNSRGFVHFRLKQFREAIHDYDAAISKNPKVASSFYVRGFAKRELGDVVGGEADIAKGKSLDAHVVTRYAGFGVK